MATERDRIIDAQKTWAESRGISFDSKGYVGAVEENLLGKSLSPSARKTFEEGAGSELDNHMRALHSSSALAANFFDYWTDRDKAVLLLALGVGADSAERLEFEAKFPTRIRGGIPPHLDVAITLDSGFVIAVECKFTEYIQRSTRGKHQFTESYFPAARDLWAQAGLPECQRLAEELHGERLKFEYLDAGQLLKHALGLATRLGDQFSLYYLYYGHSGDRAEIHGDEIARFAERVGDEIRFRALAYQEVFDRLNLSEQVEPEYLGYLESRYFNPHSPTER